MTVSSTGVRYNPFAPDFYTSDPFAVYRWMRDEAPVYRSERWGWWVLTRFEDVRAAISDPDTFRSFEGMDIDDSALEQAPPGSLPNMDNPRHDEVRQDRPAVLPAAADRRSSRTASGRWCATWSTPGATAARSISPRSWPGRCRSTCSST